MSCALIICLLLLSVVPKPFLDFRKRKFTRRVTDKKKYKGFSSSASCYHIDDMHTIMLGYHGVRARRIGKEWRVVQGDSFRAPGSGSYFINLYLRKKLLTEDNEISCSSIDKSLEILTHHYR